MKTYIPAVMRASGCVMYRHYQITSHAIERYTERSGGDIGDMLSDLNSVWVFDVNQKNVVRKVCASVAWLERGGGYALTNGRLIFMIRPGLFHHYIVTVINYEAYPVRRHGHQPAASKTPGGHIRCSY